MPLCFQIKPPCLMFDKDDVSSRKKHDFIFSDLHFL